MSRRYGTFTKLARRVTLTLLGVIDTTRGTFLANTGAAVGAVRMAHLLARPR